MYISELDIFGFKSFANRTRLKFSQGLTCVVGPNGCGKTNVVDALRWVMGEQKGSVLRSDRMTDLIFGGSKYKKPLNYAEVSLNIHNNRQVLSLAYENVVISRRLYRDGTSEYFLNQTPVRLKDIHDLFLDTGMSSNAYSVIELKMVEDILNENRESRKYLFEEAAGINKYKSQRKSTHRKLDATQEDLTRLEDIIYEVEKKVGALKRQLNKYERYQEYVEELRDLEIAFAQREWQKLQDQLIPLEEQLSNSHTSQSETGQQLSIEEAMLARYKADRDALEKKYQNYSQQIEGLNQKIGQNHEQLILWKEKSSAAIRANEHLAQEKQEAANRRIANLQRKQELENELIQNNPEFEKLKLKQNELQERVAQAENAYRQQYLHLELLRKEAISAHQKVRDQEQRHMHLGELVQQKSIEKEATESKLLDARLRLENHKSAIGESISDLKSLQEKISASETYEKTTAEKLNSQVKLISAQRERLSLLKSRLDSLMREKTFYENIIESMEGFNPGVRYTIKNLRHQGIAGTVADLIQVDENYAKAIEMALGNTARFLVSYTKNDALDLIEILKERQKGRVTIIPLDIIRDRLREPLRFDYNRAELIGPATDFVKSAPEYKALIDYFLGDLLIVNDLRAIPDDILRRSRHRFVTPDGDIFEQKGLIKGGRNAGNEQHILGRKEKLSAIKNDLNTIQNQIVSLQKKSDKLIKDKEKLDIEHQESLRKLNSQKKLLQEKEKQRDTLEYAIRHSQQQCDELSKLISRLQSDLDLTAANLEKTASEIEQATENAHTIQKKMIDFQSKHQDCIALKDQLNKELQELKIERISREREKETAQIRYQNTVDTIADLDMRIQRAAEETKENQQLIEKAQKLLENLEHEGSKLKETHTEISQLRSDCNNKLQANKIQLQKAEDSIIQQHKQRENVFQILRNLELKVSDIRMNQKQIRESILNKYRFDISLRSLSDPELNNEELEETIDKLKRRIELIGPINMAVKAEYEEDAARLIFLKEQQHDLLEAEKSLLETIETLDTEARKQFTQVFEQIRSNFQKTYALFFPEGSGDLKLIGNSDPLEADVEIYARPKTKELKTMKALSGGEKALTAIALLFSVYLVKPSPYCILDEVDAPLDDRNVDRFISVLRHFTETTQFIIVTHNKLTMKSADYLYGVTMQEEGVSKIVSVQFKKNGYDLLHKVPISS
ncbi:MAG TPA: chromosome segregation protein SMC [Candidatus Marinimicrobia bacterium]|nr:chromosome segregation protein SMC [Candidatus Neomarinimicrobiota bacterium]